MFFKEDYLFIGPYFLINYQINFFRLILVIYPYL